MRSLGVRGAYAVIRGLDNTRRTPELDACLSDLPARLRTQIDQNTLSDDTVLRGFRDLHDAVGRSNKRFVSSAETLVGLFLRKGIVPRINALVDIYNAVSLETRLSLGAHDLEQVRGDITLRLTRGGETFIPLGSTQPETIQPGEYAYCEPDGEVLCRLEHRQCERTKVTERTRDCFYIIQGNALTDEAQLRHALDRLVELTCRFCGGQLDRQWVIA